MLSVEPPVCLLPPRLNGCRLLFFVVDAFPIAILCYQRIPLTRLYEPFVCRGVAGTRRGSDAGIAFGTGRVDVSSARIASRRTRSSAQLTVGYGLAQ